MIEIIETPTLTGEMVYKTEGSAALDCFASETFTFDARFKDSVLMDLGFKLRISDPNIAAKLLIRSSMSRLGLSLSNAEGLIDSDYPDNVRASLVYNPRLSSPKQITITKGERICQLMFIPILRIESRIQNNKRSGGFGSTNESG